MSRHVALRIVLSLVLLLSQQMAITHALSHWAGPAHGQQLLEEGDSRLSAAVAQDQSCDQCLSFAQLAGAVGADSCRFTPPASQRLAIAGPLPGGPFLDSHPAYRSRAPPFLA
jgi:hypothetical protein